ncbi:ring-opening amidohydrolase [Beijerinckia sp. L45]|uniref:cyanuric acid amidohydrolase n=1 Tax=Beijerinckia sp. L45 TaxID=1641855 RepID=UPI00131B7655|nr:ring-opening amidohydrolase [Beijerinckia sp. L45]
MPIARVHRLSAAAPDDVSAIEAAIATGTLDPTGIVAILGKTEGNGCVNDFTRSFAVTALQAMLQRHIAPDAAAKICLVMSGGTEGALAPHWLVLERVPKTGGLSPALAIGRSHTAALASEHLGRRAQVDMVAAGVRDAMSDAGIDRIEDVHFVQIKCPLLTAVRVQDADRRGVTVSTRDTLKSMGLSRAASALGVALALGEVPDDAITDAGIGSDASLWSARASASSGVELLNHEIVVLGMSRHWSGPLVIDHGVMADQIDIAPVRAAAARLGLNLPTPGASPTLLAMLAKAEAGTSGRLRGYRHTMLDDSDISATRHARAFVAGALAGLVGHAEIFVSGGAEHQGPDGGGPVALIVAR